MVGVCAGVPIRLIRKHLLFYKGLVMLVDLPHGRTIVPRQSLHILNNLLHKCGGLALFQLFPDSGGVNVGKVLQLRLRNKRSSLTRRARCR